MSSKDLLELHDWTHESFLLTIKASWTPQGHARQAKHLMEKFQLSTISRPDISVIRQLRWKLFFSPIRNHRHTHIHTHIFRINKANFAHLNFPVLTSSMTVGSRSTKSARGTYCPSLVAEKKVSKLESLGVGSPPSLSVPSMLILCSRQYSSQQEAPIWTPAWPMWTLIISLIVSNFWLNKGAHKFIDQWTNYWNRWKIETDVFAGATLRTRTAFRYFLAFDTRHVIDNTQSPCFGWLLELEYYRLS